MTQAASPHPPAAIANPQPIAARGAVGIGGCGRTRVRASPSLAIKAEAADTALRAKHSSGKTLC